MQDEQEPKYIEVEKPIDYSTLPKSSKRGRPKKTYLCPECGRNVSKLSNIKLDGRDICFNCFDKLKSKLKNDIAIKYKFNN